MNLLFKPVGIIAGLVAGLIAKQIFGWVWAKIDDDEPPQPEHREIATGKFLISLALEGAVFTLVRGVVDHSSRVGYSRATGVWPGEDNTESDDSG